MVGVVSSIPSGSNFIFADFETPSMSILYKMAEMLDLCYLGKTQLRKNHSIIGFPCGGLTDVSF